MSRALNDLSDEFRPLAVEFLARTIEAGIPVMLVDTLRTAEEQAENIRKGVSWTKNSKHLTGDAIDVVPYSHYDLIGPDKLQWDASDPIWLKLGLIGEAIGLIWGGRWGRAPGSTAKPDLGHFERRIV